MPDKTTPTGQLTTGRRGTVDGRPEARQPLQTKEIKSKACSESLSISDGVHAGLGAARMDRRRARRESRACRASFALQRCCRALTRSRTAWSSVCACTRLARSLTSGPSTKTRIPFHPCWPMAALSWSLNGHLCTTAPGNQEERESKRRQEKRSSGVASRVHDEALYGQGQAGLVGMMRGPPL